MLTLAFTAPRDASMLEEELERERLEVWFVLTLAFVMARARSTLEEELDRLSEEV